ncbi:GNAT family N-acetyltransferase [Ruixingdingia sedimenti]|uniref:GNAT family N-acetyltransferase n=1 Tax=Ruixingdingia sedimenti TaxID=3073604 RepID=A0ABU1F5S6_9RHOB|nr:GNAT family N-acetyltransferase [Xinfangfangia sp. LG-4]MDR5651998.1 GNAT family N-acetyltransferase [Xinfangfangia sp. LG-4]
MTAIAFRPATIDDLPAIVALLADDGLGRGREDAGMPLNPRYLAAFAAMAADPNQMQVVAVADDAVVGTMQLSFIPGLSRLGAWRGQIEGVRIAAGQRGAGLGRAMFLWAIERCRERGCDLVQLTTDRSRADAHRFYEGLGFEGSHLGYKLRLG